jgi:hypothetical protein
MALSLALLDLILRSILSLINYLSFYYFVHYTELWLVSCYAEQLSYFKASIVDFIV